MHTHCQSCQSNFFISRYLHCLLILSEILLHEQAPLFPVHITHNDALDVCMKQSVAIYVTISCASVQMYHSLSQSLAKQAVCAIQLCGDSNMLSLQNCPDYHCHCQYIIITHKGTSYRNEQLVQTFTVNCYVHHLHGKKIQQLYLNCIPELYMYYYNNCCCMGNFGIYSNAT